MRRIPRPEPGEYPAYSSLYMDLVKTDDDVLTEMRRNLRELEDLVRGLSEEELRFRYAAGKWTIREILVHLIDDERIFAYRALRTARGDDTPLPGFDQDAYAALSGANDRTLDDILAEYASVREATLSLFAHLPEEALTRGGALLGSAGEATNHRTVRALAYHIAGHELRHLLVIRERYLGMEVAPSTWEASRREGPPDGMPSPRGPEAPSAPEVAGSAEELPGYTTLWEYRVAPGREEEFERHYGAEGSWVALFRRAPGFVETRLLRDRSAPRRYVTVDRWRSRKLYETFRTAYRGEYDELDRRCAELTTHEAPLGELAGPGEAK